MFHRLCHPIYGLGLSVLAAGLLSATAYAGTIYVNGAASGANNGTSWTDAYTDLQNALAAAVSGDDIWVAAGTYKPTSGSDRGVSFVLVNGVGVYGGFAGAESLLSERDWTRNVTVLSGDLGTPGDNEDNSNNVVTSSYCAATAVLDGFTVTGGNACLANAYGGGMYNDCSSPTLNNCTFSDNWGGGGGGMANNGMYNGVWSPTLNNCSFTGNLAFWNGGGMDNRYSSPTLNNCSFSDNWAAGDMGCGGGVSNYFSSPTLSNCTFIGNSAGYIGYDGYAGGMYNERCSSPTVTNCTFTANRATGFGGGMVSIGYASPTLRNCILWGDTAGAEIYCTSDSTATVTYSDVHGGYAGTGNLDADPRFVGAGDCRLQAGSPCIDAANGDVAPPTDILGHARRDDPATPNTGTGTPPYADIGAYEFLGTSPATHLAFTVQPSDTVAGATMTAVQVAVQDAFGNTVTTATDAITVAIGSNPGTGTLAGTLTVNAVAGVASFSDLSIDRAGVGYTLTAGAAGLAGATSSAFDIVPYGPAPHIVVRGQGQDIANGSSTTAVADDTDFGSLRVGAGEHAHTFTILNLGAADLHLTGTPRVTLSGPHPADFLVWVQPGSPVPAGGSTFCIIRFAPTGGGLRSATVAIANDDADGNPYTFAIQGTGKKRHRTVVVESSSDSGCRLAGPGTAEGSLWLSLGIALLALGAARRRRHASRQP